MSETVFYFSIIQLVKALQSEGGRLVFLTDIRINMT